MRIHPLFLLALPVAQATAQVSLRPNLSGSVVQADATLGWELVGATPYLYRLHFDTVSASLVLAPGPDATGTSWAASRLVLKAAPYRGHRVLFTAQVRYNDLLDGGLWMRADGLVGGSPGTVAFDNMERRPFRGTKTWAEYRIVLEIPPNAEYVLVGTIAHGQGTVWMRDAHLLPDPPPWFTPTVKANYAEQFRGQEVASYATLADKALSYPVPPISGTP